MVDSSAHDERRNYELSQQATQVRNYYKEQFTLGKLSINDLIELASRAPGSDSTQLRYLARTRVIELLTLVPGWNAFSARYAFAVNGLSENLRLGGCTKDRIVSVVTYLFNSRANNWQNPVEPPPGWPWHGNLLACLKDLQLGDLPREYRESRYYFSDENHHESQQHYPLSPEEKAQEIADFFQAGSGDSHPEEEEYFDDGLEDLLSDDEPEGYDLLSDDDIDDILKFN